MDSNFDVTRAHVTIQRRSVFLARSLSLFLLFPSSHNVEGASSSRSFLRGNRGECSRWLNDGDRSTNSVESGGGGTDDRRRGCSVVCGSGISIQGHIRERLFYKDGQIELQPLHPLSWETAGTEGSRGSDTTEDRRGRKDFVPSRARYFGERGCFPDLYDNDVVVVMRRMAASGFKECNGHVVKLLGRLTDADRRDAT